MKRKAILEYTIPESLTDYIDRVGYPSNGGEMMRQVERIQRDHGNRGAYYATSLFAEHLGVSHLYIRLNNRVRVVNWYRDEDNEPRVLRDDQLDDDVREDLLMRLAERDLIIPYLEDYWLQTEDPDTIYYRAADRQRNGGAQTFAAEPPADIQAEPLDPVSTASDTTEPEPTTTEPEPEPEVTPTSGTESALDRFANSGKKGLSNNPEEVEAIEELQTFLVELGLDVGNNGVDGKYGPRTTQAVKDFQNSMPGLAIDGDAGPDTIRAIRELQTDLSRIQELINIMNENAIPFTYKSGLARLLERDLTQDERTQLEELLNKYEIFRQEFPEYQTMLFSDAENIVTGAAEPQQTAEPETGEGEPETEPEPETTTEVEWEELTPNGAPDGYTIFIKRQETPVFTYGLEGGEPVDTEYATQREAIAAARAAAEEEQAATQQEPADAGDPIPERTPFEEFKRDAIQNIQSWLELGPPPTVETTETHLRLYRLEARNRQELEWLDRVYTPLPLKLARADRNYDFDGTRIRLDYDINPDNADVVQQWLRQELRPALQAARREEPEVAQTFQPNYTGNYREDLIQFYKSQLSREDAEAFVAAISLDDKDVTQLMTLQTSITRVISVLNGNQRIPDAVGEPNGGQIVNKPQAVAILRTFKDQAILDAIRNASQRSQSEPEPTTTTSSGGEIPGAVTIPQDAIDQLRRNMQ